MIFADEPTGNLDSRTGGEILSFMRAAVDDLGQTIVMVTHDAVAASSADTVLFLEDGRIVDSMANPSPDRILDRMKQFGSLSDVRHATSSRRASGPANAASSGRPSRSSSASPSSPPRSCSATPCAPASTRRSPMPTPASTSSCAAPTSSAPATARVRGAIDASAVDAVAAVPGVRAAVPSVEGVATLLGADGDRIGGDGPPTDRHQLDRRPRPQPVPTSPRAAPPRPPARSSSTAARPSAATSTSATRTTVLTPTPVEVTVVGIATFGDVDSLGPTTYTAFTLPQASELFAQRPDTHLVGPRGRRGRGQPGDAARRDHRAARRRASRR